MNWNKFSLFYLIRCGHHNDDQRVESNAMPKKKTKRERRIIRKKDNFLRRRDRCIGKGEGSRKQGYDAEILLYFYLFLQWVK